MAPSISEVFDPGTVSRQQYEQSRYYTISQKRLARIVGAIAFFLPIVTLAAGLLKKVCSYDSLSHFYYSRFFGDVFVGSLIFIGVFLIAYRGERKIENRLASFAGVCAICVALFPTKYHGCNLTEFQTRAFVSVEVQGTNLPLRIKQVEKTKENIGAAFQLFPWSAVVHYAAASLLFAFLAWYAFKVFPRSVEDIHTKSEERRPLSTAKKRRNAIYYFCGCVIVLCIVALASYGLSGDEGWPWWNKRDLTFWCEAFALWAFGLSWMVKGRLWNWRWIMDDHEFQPLNPKPVPAAGQ